MNADNLLSLAASVCGGAVALFVFSLAYWTARDISARSHDFFTRVAAILLVVGLNLFGLVIYLLLRPPETLAEKQERGLVEEILAREATAAQVRRRAEAPPAPPRTG
jgi:hypothetical protein